MQNIEIQIGGAELTSFLIRIIGDARMILRKAGTLLYKSSGNLKTRRAIGSKWISGVRGGQKITFTVTNFI